MATASNTNALTFTAATSGLVNTDATHVGLWTHSTGGTFLGGDSISNNPAPLALGEAYRLASGVLQITVPDGEFTSAMSTRMVQGAISGTLYVSVHNGDPGSNGANAISGITRVSIVVADWTIT